MCTPSVYPYLTSDIARDPEESGRWRGEVERKESSGGPGLRWTTIKVCVPSRLPPCSWLHYPIHLASCTFIFNKESPWTRWNIPLQYLINIQTEETRRGRMKEKDSYSGWFGKNWRWGLRGGNGLLSNSVDKRGAISLALQPLPGPGGVRPLVDNNL